MKVLNFGSLNVDYVYKVHHIVQKGETQLALSRSIFPGGKGLNQSIALKRAGLSVFHAGSIGSGGEFLLDILNDENVDTSMVRSLKEVPVGHTIIQNSMDGDNSILVYGGANRAITQSQIEDTLKHFSKGDYLILQNEVNLLKEIVELAHKNGMIIVLNPSPISQIFEDFDFSMIDYLFLNEIEAKELTNSKSTDPEELIDRIDEKWPYIQVFLTLGEGGSVYIHEGEHIFQKVYKVPVVDTTSAGDTFTGFCLAGIIEGFTISQALDYAARAAAIAVTKLGAEPSIPTKNSVKEYSFD